MATRSLASYLDAAMRRAHTGPAQLERDYHESVGMTANWVRSLKGGWIKKRPNPLWVTTLATALNIPEAEIWGRLGRFDQVARLRDQRPAGMEDQPPAWAVEIMRKLDEISHRLDQLEQPGSERSDQR